MSTNDILRSIRYLLHVSDDAMVEITALGRYLVTREEMKAYLRKEDEPGYAECPDELVAHFLDGLIVHKRGADPSRPPRPIEVPVTNNLVLKKLRVAFGLKDTDLIALLEKSGTLKVTPAEVSALFRSPDHRNYRECGDQFLRNVFRAMSL